MNSIASDAIADFRPGRASPAPSRSPVALYADDFAQLLSVAEGVCALRPTTDRLGVSGLDVVRDVLLHCGGLGNLWNTEDSFATRCEGALTRLVRRREDVPFGGTSGPGIALTSVNVSAIDETTAQALYRGLHYLGSGRRDAWHFGLTCSSPDRPNPVILGLASFSRFDLEHLVPKLISPAMAQRTLVLSRLLSLPGAPKNGPSRLLGGAFRWLRRHAPSIDMLISYNNPNLGFLGTVYKATNWELLGLDAKRPDMALDGKYVSLRELKERFGGFEFGELSAQLGDRLKLLPPMRWPLEIYAKRLRRDAGGTPRGAASRDGR